MNPLILLKSLLDWLKGLRYDARWKRNAKLSIKLWVFNFLVFLLVVSRTGHSIAVNITLSLMWDFVWYFINKDHLWEDRQTPTLVSASRSVAAWGVFFTLNQLAYAAVVTTTGLHGMVAKPVLIPVAIAFSIVRYALNGKWIFPARAEMA